MTVAFGPVRKRFTTTGVLHRPHRIDITSDDPMFDHFVQRRTFESAAGDSTIIEYRVDLKLRSCMLQILMAATFIKEAAATISAFKRRADQVYGTQP